MKKQILNIGKALSRAEQKQVFGGNVLIEDGGHHQQLATVKMVLKTSNQIALGVHRFAVEEEVIKEFVSNGVNLFNE
ncbi:hypothetical protein BXQ17_10410 [Polaribacter sp. BM10]|uniref:hypothetical protein n=1 Tax=Polaribacter sp. BM10 TaxID=1529069 RepID=UPI00098B4B1A|nr:hypothetical protein [Polaribacter sp. BM10]AQS94451.1 hypothetical protein BXQ17_10410 [Polaribacter sp. BM10]